MSQALLEPVRSYAPPAAQRIPDAVARTVVTAQSYSNGKALEGAFKWLRNKMPLAQVQMPAMDSCWVVTKHADILEVSRQNELFRSGDLALDIRSKEADARIRNLTGGSPNFMTTLLTMDGDYHRQSRYITQGYFMSQNIRRLEERVRVIACEHLDRMAEAGPACDFAQDVAWTFPLYVLLDNLGLPRTTAEPVLTLTQEFLSHSDPELRRQDAEKSNPVVLAGILAELWGHLKPFADARRGDPRDDLLSLIANGKVDGEYLDDMRIMSYVLLLILAGHDTTSFAMAGGVMGLCEFPGEFDKLRADPSLVAGAVEESIRWTTPVKHFMRTATADYEMRGQTIRAGDWLMLAYPSGNRDEEVFDEPDVFKVGRNPNRHLSFGTGGHLCLGQHLAKLEMRILFEELRTRLTSLEFDGEPALAESINVGGPKRVPIRFRLS